MSTRVAQSKPRAPPTRTVASLAGNTKPWWKLLKSASTNEPERMRAVGRQSTPFRHPESLDGRRSLAHTQPGQGEHRDQPEGFRLTTSDGCSPEQHALYDALELGRYLTP
jgi:hypothetical protein